MTSQRYFGLDVHKRYVTVAAVDQRQSQLVRAKKITTARFAQWAEGNLQASDWVALEATTNSWTFYDQLSPMVERVSVANCYKMKLISASAAKTDRHDALVLAKLLAANLLPTVWVPPHHVR